LPLPACLLATLAGERAEKAHAAQLAALEDARRKEMARFEEKIARLQGEIEKTNERHAKLNSLYASSLQKPEELKAECAQHQADIKQLKRELEDSRKTLDSHRLMGDDKLDKLTRRDRELSQQVEMLQHQLQETARARERDAIYANGTMEALQRKDAEIQNLSRQVHNLQRQLSSGGASSISPVPAADSTNPSFTPSSLFNIPWSSRTRELAAPAVEARPVSMPMASSQGHDEGEATSSMKAVLERCPHCGIKGEPSVIRATGPHHGRICPSFVWMVGDKPSDLRPHSVLLH